MDAEDIKSRCEQLMGTSVDGQVVRVSDVGKYFIPAYASGTKEDKEAGTSKHQERDDAMEDIAWEGTWDELQDEVTISEWFIRSPVPDHEDLILSGKIDAVQFVDSRPTVVVERKYPRPRNLDTVYPSEQIQAWTYCYMLDALEFDTTNLKYCVLKLPRSIKNDDAEALARQLFTAAKDQNLKTTAKAIENELGKGTVLTEQFNIEAHRDDFEEAIQHQ